MKYIYIFTYDLHGPRHIQKTRPKLIAIEPKLIAIHWNIMMFSCAYFVLKIYSRIVFKLHL